MTERNDVIAIRQMRDHALEAIAIAKDRFRSDLDSDRVFALALTKLVELIGDSSFRVSPSTRVHHTEIPWNQIIGTRNRPVHGYDQIDFDILWHIVKNELPPLITALESILSDQEYPPLA